MAKVYPLGTDINIEETSTDFLINNNTTALLTINKSNQSALIKVANLATLSGKIAGAVSLDNSGAATVTGSTSTVDSIIFLFARGGTGKVNYNISVTPGTFDITSDAGGADEFLEVNWLIVN